MVEEANNFDLIGLVGTYPADELLLGFGADPPPDHVYQHGRYVKGPNSRREREEGVSRLMEWWIETASSIVRPGSAPRSSASSSRNGHSGWGRRAEEMV